MSSLNRAGKDLQLKGLTDAAVEARIGRGQTNNRGAGGAPQIELWRHRVCPRIQPDVSEQRGRERCKTRRNHWSGRRIPSRTRDEDPDILRRTRAACPEDRNESRPQAPARCDDDALANTETRPRAGGRERRPSEIRAGLPKRARVERRRGQTAGAWPSRCC